MIRKKRLINTTKSCEVRNFFLFLLMLSANVLLRLRFDVVASQIRSQIMTHAEGSPLDWGCASDCVSDGTYGDHVPIKTSGPEHFF